MPSSWQSRALREICLLKPPKAEIRSKLDDVDEVSFVPMEDLGIGQKHFESPKTRQLGDVVGSYTYFADGDVLLAKITPCFENGKLGVAKGLKNGVGFGSSEFIVFRPSECLDPDFLYYFLSRAAFLEEGAKRMTGAVGHKRVAKEFIEDLIIPVPSISEQRRIVTILDQAFEAVATAKANAERNLRNASELFALSVDDLFRSLISDSPTPCTLGELATFRNGINFTKNSKGDRVRIIGVKDFQQNFDVRTDDLEWVALDGRLSASDCVEVGDIVFVRSNGNPELIGRCMLVGALAEPTVHSGFTIKLRLHDQRLDARFLCHYLKSSAIRRELVEGGNGANIKSLNQGTLSAVRVPVPSKTLQRELVDQIEALEHQVADLKLIYQRKLSALDELKQSLLYQAFTGQL